jgi:uncharacterized protein (TIGR02996 family)
MSDEADFVRAIQENPEDDRARLVYADWLEERGDIRGEYLRLDCQLVHIPLRLVQLRKQVDQTWLETVTRRRRLAADAFTGAWANIDEQTDGWARLDINTVGTTGTIRAWARSDFQCYQEELRLSAEAHDPDHHPPPEPPPLGALHLLADSVCDTELKYGIGFWDYGFVESHMTLRLEGDELVAEEFNVFKDDSGRSNYCWQAKFRKIK